MPAAIVDAGLDDFETVLKVSASAVFASRLSRCLNLAYVAIAKPVFLLLRHVMKDKRRLLGKRNGLRLERSILCSTKLVYLARLLCAFSVRLSLRFGFGAETSRRLCHSW